MGASTLVQVEVVHSLVGNRDDVWVQLPQCCSNPQVRRAHGHLRRVAVGEATWASNDR